MSIKTNSPGFLELHSNETYKNVIIEALSHGIPTESVKEYNRLMEYVIDEKYILFDREEFKGSIYEDEDDTLDLILPSIRKVFSKIYIDPPSLFKDERFDIFKGYFDIDDFLYYLIDMILKCKNVCVYFLYLDRLVETLELIVDNYIAKLVKMVLDEDFAKTELRDIKINRIIK